jgi:ABC-type polysaccharide/polyol phosphate transport system ATPase subunit
VSANSIDLSRVSLLRRTQEEMHYDFKRLFFSLLQNKYRRPTRRRVLSDVTLQIARGTKIGIIGANGSGKSTLLKVICGILEPTTGTVGVVGSIAPLIELGAGFDSELSVADNIVYYGILLGHTRQSMMDRMAAILEFAELSDRRKEPVKALSSGMVARLGFAIATEIRPDILILDEVLSVGDESFRQKCQDRIKGLWDENLTVIVVSHDMGFIAENCHLAVRLDEGRIVDRGPAASVVGSYLDHVHARNHDALGLAGYNRFVELPPERVREFSRCTASLDNFELDPVDPDALMVRGWAVLTCPDGVADDAYVLIGDTHLTRLPYGFPRPDVALVLNDDRLHATGFQARIDLPVLPPSSYPLRVVMRRGDVIGISDELTHIEVRSRDHRLASLG